MTISRPLLAAMLLASLPALAQTSTTMTVKDGAGVTRQMRAEQNNDGSLSTHTVPEVNGAAVSSQNPLPTQGANDGASGTGITQPTGGGGILGWLSGIYQKLSGTLTVGGSVSVSNLPATQAVSASALPLPSNAAQETGGNLATIATNTTGAATAANQTTGNSSLSAIATNTAALNSTLPTKTPTLTYTTSTSVSVGTTSTQVVASGAATRSLTICTLPASSTNVWLNPTGGSATTSSGVPVFAGGGCTSFGTQGMPIPTGAVTGITDGGLSQTVTVVGG